MGPIGIQEMIAIFVIALVLFGPKKLPELGRMLGKGLSEFRRAKSELTATFESHLRELERETREAQTPTATTPALPATEYSAQRYSYPYEDQGTWETGNSQQTVPAETYGAAPAIEPAPAQQAPLYPDETASHSAPIAGTVPRASVSPRPEEHTA